MTTKKAVKKTPATKTISLPPYPVLRAALVARWEYERGERNDLGEVAEALGFTNTDAVRKAATKAAQLCAGKTCWFCGKENKNSKELDWAAFTLCACLNHLRHGVVWHIPAKTGANLLAIQNDVALGVLPATAPVVTRPCECTVRDETGTRRCGTRFTLTAGYYAGSVESAVRALTVKDAQSGVVRSDVEKLSEFKHSVRCRSCQTEAKRQRWAQDKSAKRSPSGAQEVRTKIQAVR